MFPKSLDTILAKATGMLLHMLAILFLTIGMSTTDIMVSGEIPNKLVNHIDNNVIITSWQYFKCSADVPSKPQLLLSFKSYGMDDLQV